MPLRLKSILNTKYEIRNTEFQTGFTLFELMIVLAIMAMLSAVVLTFLPFFQRGKEYDSDRDKIAVYLRQAQSKSMSQEQGKQWGIHFDNTDPASPGYSLFSGTPFSPGNAVETFALAPTVNYGLPLSGAASDVSFGKLSGYLASPLTLAINLKMRPSINAIVQISSKGLLSLAEGLAAYWGLEEGAGGTTADNSGRGFIGVVNGASRLGGASCKVGDHCLSLNGSGNYVGIGPRKFDDLADATVELWFYYEGTFDTDRVFFSRYKDGNNRMPVFVSYPAGYGNKIVFENDVEGTNRGIVSDGSIAPNTWYHVVLMCGSGGMKMYVNGTQQSATNPTADCFSAIAGTTSTDIGTHGGSAFFKGRIDEVRIFPYIRTPEQVLADYQAGL